MADMQIILADLERQCSNPRKEPVLFFLSKKKQIIFNMCSCCERAAKQFMAINNVNQRKR